MTRRWAARHAVPRRHEGAFDGNGTGSGGRAAADGGAGARGALAEVGPIPFRAPVGDRARRLQRLGQCLGLLQPRPGAFPRLPVGRGRAGRRLRRPAAALLRAGPVEREGSDPQGAAVRPDEQRGKPRRGRQGVLLLPRLHADPLVHEVPLQVPAGGLPVRRPRRDEPPPGEARLRVRAHRHGRVRSGPVLRRVRRVREGVAGGPPRPGHRLEPRSGGGDAPRLADPLVPQPVVMGRRCAPADAPAGRRGPDRRDLGLPSGARGAVPRLRGRGRAALHRERDEQRAALRGARTARLTSRTASTSTWWAAAGRR